MSLTWTFKQTHRHYRDQVQNLVDTDEARERGLTLIADCGKAWIPGFASETDDLPMCPDCVTADRRRSNGSDRPHYVYRCWDGNGRLIYVGVSVAPLQRMDQHKTNSWWFDQTARVTYRVFPTREYAMARERQAIAEENPRWNVRGRDREAWSADDYRDAHHSMTVRGAKVDRIHKLRLEAVRRWNVDLVQEEATA